MAIDTTVQPFIQRMLHPADPKAGAEALSGAISNFIGAKLAREEVDKEQAALPKEQQASGFSRFAQAYNRMPGKIAEGRTPFGELERRERVGRVTHIEQENSLNAQLGRLVRDPEGLATEVGNLSPEEIPEWLQKNAGLAANPIGKRMWDAVNQAWQQSSAAKMQAAQEKDNVDLVLNYGARIGDEASFGKARAQRNWFELKKELQAQGRDPNSIQFEPDLFDERGDWRVPGLRERLMQEASPSLSLQQRENEAMIRLQIAEDRVAAMLEIAELREQTGKSFAPSEAGKKAAEYERAVGRALTDEERGIFYGLKARPGVTHELLRTEYIQRKLEAWLRGIEGMGKTRQQAIEALGKEFDENFSAPTTQSPTESTPPAQQQQPQTAPGWFDRFKKWQERQP